MKFLQRVPWYLVGGLVLGITLGLVWSWMISPVKYVDAAPAALRADFKEQYRDLIAAAYQAEGDLGLARARLEILGDADPVTALNDQASRTLAQGDPEGRAYTLLLLAQALLPATPTEMVSPPGPTATQTGIVVAASMPPEATATGTAQGSPEPTTQDDLSATPDGTGQPSPTPSPTATLRPTRTPAPTPANPFVLESREEVCDPARIDTQLQVELLDASGAPLPGQEITVTWSGGREHFFTGLKPELGEGYADFRMTPEVIYSVQAGTGGEVVSGLQAPSCGSGGAAWWGGIRLVFQEGH